MKTQISKHTLKVGDTVLVMNGSDPVVARVHYCSDKGEVLLDFGPVRPKGMGWSGTQRLAGPRRRRPRLSPTHFYWWLEYGQKLYTMSPSTHLALLLRKKLGM